MKKLPADLDFKIREKFRRRCAYCLLPQQLTSSRLEIDHILPQSKSGGDEESNLCLACRECNLRKSDQTHGFDSLKLKSIKLFHPQRQQWKRHFIFDENQTKIVGKTACGRATVAALDLNNERQVTARSFWKLTDLFPPQD